MVNDESEVTPAFSAEEVDPVEEYASHLGIALPKDIVILPSNFFTVKQKEELTYPFYALDVKAVFRATGLTAEFIEDGGKPLPIVELRDMAWYGPILFVSLAAISHDPNVISVCLNVLSNHIYDFFKGRQGQNRARFSVVIEKAKGKKSIKIDFDGPPDKLPDLELFIKKF